MLKTIMENENTSFANISIPFEHDLRKGMEIQAKLVFSFSIIVFDMMNLLVVLYIVKLIAQINIFEFPSLMFVVVLTKSMEDSCIPASKAKTGNEMNWSLKTSTVMRVELFKFVLVEKVIDISFSKYLLIKSTEYFEHIINEKFVYLFIYLFIYLFVCVFVCLFVCLFIYLYF